MFNQKLFSIIFLLVLSFLIITPFSVVQAEDDVTTSDSSQRIRVKNEVNTDREVKQGIKTRVQDKRDEVKSRITASKKERILSFSNRLIIRLETTVARLEKVIARMNERIQKIKDLEYDIDTSSAEESIAKAEGLITTVKTQIAALKNSLNEIPSSEDPKEAFKSIRESLNSIQDNLKEAHKALVMAIGEIKGLRVGDKNDEK